MFCGDDVAAEGGEPRVQCLRPYAEDGWLGEAQRRLERAVAAFVEVIAVHVQLVDTVLFWLIIKYEVQVLLPGRLLRLLASCAKLAMPTRP
jgi:hypothetical protein